MVRFNFIVFCPASNVYTCVEKLMIMAFSLQIVIVTYGGVGFGKMERMGESQNTLNGSLIYDLVRVNFFLK